MAGRTLEEYFVSLGIKGQNVVLANIDKVKKKAADLSKIKTSVNIKSKGGLFGGVSGNNIIPPQTPSPEEVKNNKKFSDNINKFAGGSKEFVKGVAHFDPVSAVQQTISSTGSALGALAKAIPVVGDYMKDLPKGVSDITNAFIGMGSGALQMAKEAAAGQYAISNRNATTKYYGGNKSEIGQSNLSNAQYSEFIMTIAGSYGKIQKPMQGILDELVKTKNTEALGRVASGNWQSTGTDRGWMLQQISNQTQGLPPSIAQAIQNSLLQSNKDLIQEKGAESGAQGKTATFLNQAEEQTAALFGKLDEKTMSSLTSLNSSLNKMQVAMFDAGLGMASQIDKAAGKIKELVESFEKMKKAVNEFSVMGHGAPQLIKDLFK